MHNELYKTGIIGPCSVIAIGMICTLINFIIVKPRKTDLTNQTKKQASKTKSDNEDDADNVVRIHKVKVHLFENLAMWGYEKSKIAKWIQNCNNISEAIEVMDRLDAEAEAKTLKLLSS